MLEKVFDILSVDILTAEWQEYLQQCAIYTVRPCQLRVIVVWCVVSEGVGLLNRLS